MTLGPCEICKNKSIGEVVEYSEQSGNPTNDRHFFCVDHLLNGYEKYSHTFKYNRL